MPRAAPALEAYERKRDFDKTSEPRPQARRRGRQGNLFVIQRHWATREHFDLRLELDGVLLSWAVTRGPSLNPADKRLAVRTEDHPLDYGDYEGVIPKGQYGGGTVMLWDRGTWEPQGGDPRKDLKAGQLKFIAHGERIKGGYALIRMRRDEPRESWLLVKEKDAFADRDANPVEAFRTSIATGRDRDEIAGTAPSGAGTKPAAKRKPATPAKPAPGRPIAITHAERVVFPEAKVTKGDIAAYYDRVAKLILPHLEDRPVSFVRAPEGIAAETFFQRHPLNGMKRGVRRIPDPERRHEDYLVIADASGLQTAAQFGVVELHGWGCRAPSLDHPDRMVFDLDPDDEVAFAEVIAAALEVKRLLEGVGLKSFPMLSGGKGVHVIAPLDRSQDWDTVSLFTKGIARGMAQADPARYIATASKARREGKIYIDWLRNRLTASAIVPWSLRARPKATIAAPVTWPELERAKSPGAYDIHAKPLKNPWKGFFALRQSIPACSS